MIQKLYSDVLNESTMEFLPPVIYDKDTAERCGLQFYMHNGKLHYRTKNCGDYECLFEFDKHIGVMTITVDKPASIFK